MTSPATSYDSEMLSRPARVFAALLPDAYRDEIVGDLIEQAQRTVEPEQGDRAARRWITGQIAASLPSMLSLHFKQEEDPQMKHAKWIAAVAIVVMGSVQAWDSGILEAPIGIALMVVLAIGVGLVGLFVSSEGVRFGAAVLSLVLLFFARILSPVNLPELALVGLPIFLILVLGPKFAALRKPPPTSGAM